MKMGVGWSAVPEAAAEAPERQGPGLLLHVLPAAPQAVGVPEGSDSAELFATPETSDDSYEPPSLRHSRSRTGSLGCRRL